MGVEFWSLRGLASSNYLSQWENFEFVWLPFGPYEKSEFCISWWSENRAIVFQVVSVSAGA